MSLARWLIISTLISMPFMFIFPSENQIIDKDSQKLLVDLQFSTACSNAFSNCTIETVKSIYAECVEAYGNLTLEQCRSKCCSTPVNFTSIFSIQQP